MTTELAKYDAMRRAIEECHSIDEAAQIADQAAAYAAYERQAHDDVMWAWCMEIKARAEYQIGILMEAQRASAQGMNKGGRPKKKTGSAPDPVSDALKPVTLAEVGIDKGLADRSRKRAARGKEQMEADIVAMKSRATKAANGDRRLAKKYQQQSQIQNPGYNDILTNLLKTTDDVRRWNRQVINGEKLAAAAKWLAANELTDSAARELRRLKSALCEMRDSIDNVLGKLPEAATDILESEPHVEQQEEVVH